MKYGIMVVARAFVVCVVIATAGLLSGETVAGQAEKPLMATREIVVEKRFLHLPVQNGSRPRQVDLIVDGQTVRYFTIEAADGETVDWWASFDISAWEGRKLIVSHKTVPGSKFLERVMQGDVLNNADATIYREPLRPLIHVSPRRGFNNDPNGLVFYNGEYHLFYQLNPTGLSMGNQHWGHAVSRDLVRWEHLPIALHKDQTGSMYSGSAVVDWNNTSGFGKDGKPPLVLIYTGTRVGQCLAWSLDGRAFTKYEKNPALPTIAPGNRDPKVFWHEPTKRWVMVLYVGLPEAKKNLHFFTSPNLKEWEMTSRIEGFFECPDFFPLAVDGAPRQTKWLLTGADSNYMLGSFDGRTFTPETTMLKGHRGAGFYAAQSFNDLPATDGRRISMGWLKAPAPGMPFTQAISVPLNLTLLGTPDGPRLSFLPVKELAQLRRESCRAENLALQPGVADPLAKAPRAEALEVRVEFEPSADAEVELTVRGVRIRYADGKLTVNDLRADAPLRQGRQRLVVLADRTCFEVFAGDGLCYVPLPVIAAPEAQAASLTVTRGSAKIAVAEVHTLRSIWEKGR